MFSFTKVHTYYNTLDTSEDQKCDDRLRCCATAYHARRAASAAQQRSLALQHEQERNSRLSRLPPSLRTAAFGVTNVWDLIRSPFGTRPAFRVGQVDAELLDEELLDLLKNQAGEGLKLLGAHLKDDWAAEIGAVLRAALWKLSIWDHGASYGASLQGLRYVDARSDDSAVREATKLQRIAYGLITVGGRYGWSRWEERLSSLENGYDEPSPMIQRLSKFTSLADNTHSIAAFFSFLIFLYNGRYRTLTDRILRLRLVPSTNQTNREVSFEYLNRQLVWHAFTEFLLFLLPLVGIGRWRRWLAKAWKKVGQTATRMVSGTARPEEEDMQAGELAFLPERTCAICYQDQNPTGGQSEQEVISAGASGGVIGSAATDITNPYETIPCGCIYCFVCLAQRIEAEEGEGFRLQTGLIIPPNSCQVPLTASDVNILDLYSSISNFRISISSLCQRDTNKTLEHKLQHLTRSSGGISSFSTL